jgi:hypothetical protein
MYLVLSVFILRQITLQNMNVKYLINKYVNQID